MGWPYDGGLWRGNAKPAQEQYALVAKAISQFEPLIMFADPEVLLYRKSDASIWKAFHLAVLHWPTVPSRT